MQTLEQRRKTNTPTDASQVRGNCDLQLNRDESLSVASLKTCFNIPEVNQSQHTARHKAIVYVISKEGKPLMPCTPAKAKKLLKNKRAQVVKRFPFTIKLLFTCENQVQNVELGIDTGYQNIGFSAKTEKKEMMSGTLVLDGETSSRLKARKMYRRGRRNKLRYRKPRFLNRGNKKEGWLPPSTQRRCDAHLKIINLIKSILPISKITLETATFDIQKIMNPEISGIGYQQGDLYCHQNMRSYLIARENGKCQICGEEKGADKLHHHHIIERANGGTNRASNLALTHLRCHKNLHREGLKLKPNKQFKAETFMSISRNFIVNKLREEGLNSVETEVVFGYETYIKRSELGLDKSHVNDAFVISGGTNQKRCRPINIIQKHRNNRVLQINYNTPSKGKKKYRSIRRQKYAIQPQDLVWINGKTVTTKGCQNLGKVVMLKSGTIGIKKIEKYYNYGSFVFTYS